jgi:hypothetical protein
MIDPDPALFLSALICARDDNCQQEDSEAETAELEPGAAVVGTGAGGEIFHGADLPVEELRRDGCRYFDRSWAEMVAFLLCGRAVRQEMLQEFCACAKPQPSEAVKKKGTLILANRH